MLRFENTGNTLLQNGCKTFFRAFHARYFCCNKKTILWLEVHQEDVSGLKFSKHFRKQYTRGSGSLRTEYIIKLSTGKDYYLYAPHKSLKEVASDDLSGLELMDAISNYNQTMQSSYSSRLWRWIVKDDHDNFVVNPQPIDYNPVE